MVFILLFALAFPQQKALAARGKRYPVGVRTIGIWNEESHERLDVAVWYPAITAKSNFEIDGRQIDAHHKGAIRKGFFPIILLSHDTAGNRFTHHDMAVPLASAGFIVVAPTHEGDNPYNSSGIFTAGLLYERPRHLLRALEAVLESPELSQQADESRIGVIGVGLGGLSAMQLAGVRPDFSDIGSFCSQKADDPLCTSWTLKRLEKISPDMEALIKKQGEAAFTPHLSLYAPELVAVAPEQAVAEMSLKALESQNTPSVFQNMFNRAEAPLPQILPEDPQIASPPPPAQPETAVTLDAFGVGVQMTPGKGLYESETTWQLVIVASPEEPNGNEQTKQETPPPKKHDRVYRRPAERRTIRAVAVIAPGGGMFLPQPGIGGMTLPLAVVELENDELYPPKDHSLPYYQDLVSPAARLVFEDLDHYSIFSPCSSHMAATLAQGCGNASPSEREKAGKKRDEFLIEFFTNILGGPLDPVSPSNLIAAEAIKPLETGAGPEKKNEQEASSTPAPEER